MSHLTFSTIYNRNSRLNYGSKSRTTCIQQCNTVDCFQTVDFNLVQVDVYIMGMLQQCISKGSLNLKGFHQVIPKLLFIFYLL